MKRQCAAFFAIAVFSLVLPPIFCQAANSDDVPLLTLAEIDQLIRDTNYNDALPALARYQREYPDAFDAAQRRIQKIFTARNRYSAKAEELIDVITNDPGNNRKILDIIAELDALERHPSARQLAFIAEARVAAQFNYYRAQFLELQERAAALFAAGNYVGAVEVNRSGFSMYQDDFFEEYDGQQIAQTARTALAAVDTDIERYRAIQNRFSQACDTFVQAVNRRNASDAAARFTAVQAVCADYAALRNAFVAEGKRFETLFARIREENPAATDASFLPFVSRFMFGRTGVEHAGIVGIVDGQWDIQMNRMKNAVVSAVHAENAAFAERVANGFLDGIAAGEVFLAAAENLSAVGIQVNNLYTLLTDEAGAERSTYPAYAASLMYERGLIALLQEALNTAHQLQEEKARAAALVAPAQPGAAERTAGPYATQMRSAIARVAAVVTAMSGEYAERAWAQAYQDARQHADTADAVISWETLERVYSAGTAAIRAQAQDEMHALWQRVGQYYAAAGTTYVASAREEYAAAQVMIDGTVQEDDTTPVVRYPQEALTRLETLAARVAADRTLLTNARNVISGSGDRAVQETAGSSLDESIAALSAVARAIAASSETARTFVQRAQRARNEGDLRYSQAQTALRQRDYDTARRRVQEARARYNESLSYQESATLRSTSDGNLAALGNEITRLENEQIVGEVRQLKTRARTEYYNGNFETAESLLNQARARWAVTNVDEDAEITSMLALVSTALSMKTGRVIPATAPLYPEMSQILNIARTYFSEGQQQLTAGNRTQGRDLLRKALQKLQELQLVYPLNQEASLLTLRINRVLDPRGFETMFAERVAAARETYRNPDMQRSAYTDLVDLYEINPNYPGLSELIYQVEIAIGVRQPPVDTTALNRSRDLTAQAQRIVNAAGRDEIRLRQALALVDEAIELNSGNDAAVLLKDRIQIAIGGQAAVVLTSEDEVKYQQAIQAMQRNNIITANALIEQLLQNPMNRRSSKLLDLQRQIQALL
ncbi:MAG: hypothetical protein IJ191_09240 [Treponema sp.]|nr:hypothetical protein [Treponema sp.]